MMGELSSGSGLGALLIFEVVEQGIGDRLFGNRYLVSFHRGRQRRVPCCSDRRAAECRVMGLGRPDCHEIVRCAEPPRQRPMVPQDRVGDGHAGPVEVAMVEEAGAGAGELCQEGSLGGGRHAIGADQWAAPCAEAICGDGDQVGILADVDVLTFDLPAPSGAHEGAQGKKRWLAKRPVVVPILRRKVQEQGRARQLVYQDARCRPGVSRPLGCRWRPDLVRRRDAAALHGEDESRHGLTVVESVGIAKRFGRQVRSGLSVGRQALQHRFGLPAQPRGRRRILSRQALQQAEAGRHPQQRGEARMAAIRDQVCPLHMQTLTRGRQVEDRSVQSLQRIAQGAGDAG